MDSDSLQAELNALRKLYGLLQISGSSQQSAISRILDEESRVLLRKLLDDASERVFEAHIKIMADNWRSLLGTHCLNQLEEAKTTEISQLSTPSNAAKSPRLDPNIKGNVESHAVLQKDEQPLKMKKLHNAPSLTSRLRRSATELQSRKKRCLSCEQGTKLDESTNTQSAADKGLNPLNEQQKIPTQACALSIPNQDSFSASSKAPGKEVENKATHVEDFSKEVDDAIKRIESLIPSLHRLAKPIRPPSGKKMGNQDSFKKTNSVLDLDTIGSSSGRTNAVKLLKSTTGYSQLVPKTHQLMSDTSYEQDDTSKGYRFLEESSVQIPNHIQERRILPSHINEDNATQYRIPQKDVKRKKTPTSRSSISVRSITNNRERIDKRKSVRRANQVHPRGSASPEKHPRSRRKAGVEESDHFPPSFDESEETLSGSPSSSSWTTVEASFSSSPRDMSHTSSSYTAENGDTGSSGSSSRYVTSQSSSRYDEASSNSAPDYGGGELNASEYYQSSHHHSVRHKQASRFKRLKNKLGLIFHHHHHHHHHDKGGKSPVSGWKPLGKMFGHKEKGEAKNPKAGTHNNKGKHLAKSGSHKQQVGHFHTLVEGMMRHVKHSKKAKQGKRNVGNVGGRRLGGKKQKWWQNKARVKLRGRDKKPQLTAPKSHLKHSG